MANRYFVTPPIDTDIVILAGTEAHHMIHVMRANPGAEVLLFDGSGAEFLAKVSRIDRSQVELKVLSRAETDRESPVDVTLGVSLPKGDRQKWLVEKVPMFLQLPVQQMTQSHLIFAVGALLNHS